MAGHLVGVAGFDEEISRILVFLLFAAKETEATAGALEGFLGLRSSVLAIVTRRVVGGGGVVYLLQKGARVLRHLDDVSCVVLKVGSRWECVKRSVLGVSQSWLCRCSFTKVECRQCFEADLGRMTPAGVRYVGLRQELPCRTRAPIFNLDLFASLATSTRANTHSCSPCQYVRIAEWPYAVLSAKRVKCLPNQPQPTSSLNQAGPYAPSCQTTYPPRP